MSMHPPADELERQAAAWVVRLDRRDTPEERECLDAWLASSPRHRVAFVRLSAAWSRADALRRLASPGGAVNPDRVDPEAPDAELMKWRPERGFHSRSARTKRGLEASSLGVAHTSGNRFISILIELSNYAVVASCAVGAFQLAGLLFLALETTPSFDGLTATATATASAGPSAFQVTIMTGSCFLGAAIGRLSLRSQEQDP